VLAGNPAPKRLGSGLAGVVPYGAFPASDSWVFISAGNDQAWQRMCSALEAPALTTEEAFSTNASRVSHRQEVTAALSLITQRLTSAEILARLTVAAVPCSPVHTVDEVARDEQVLATGALRPLPREDIPGLTVVNPPMTFDGEYPAFDIPPPALGADSVAVLRDLGVTDDEIAHLIAMGVVEAKDAESLARSTSERSTP